MHFFLHFLEYRLNNENYKENIKTQRMKLTKLRVSINK